MIVPLLTGWESNMCEVCVTCLRSCQQLVDLQLSWLPLSRHTVCQTLFQQLLRVLSHVICKVISCYGRHHYLHFTGEEIATVSVFPRATQPVSGGATSSHFCMAHAPLLTFLAPRLCMESASCMMTPRLCLYEIVGDVCFVPGSPDGSLCLYVDLFYTLTHLLRDSKHSH